MELLDQPTYHGPPPRYAAGDVVYYRGLVYGVDRVGNRAPLVGWTYTLDGPGELVTVGEGEISHRPQEAQTVAQRWYAQTFAGVRQSLYGAWRTVDPAYLAAAQQAADEERTLITLAALSGQPLAVCRAALDAYPFGPAYLLDQLKWGTVEITPDGDVRYIAPRRSAAATVAALQAAAQTPAPPTPRLSRRERRAKHRPWTPPNR